MLRPKTTDDAKISVLFRWKKTETKTRTYTINEKSGPVVTSKPKSRKIFSILFRCRLVKKWRSHCVEKKTKKNSSDDCTRKPHRAEVKSKSDRGGRFQPEKSDQPIVSKGGVASDRGEWLIKWNRTKFWRNRQMTSKNKNTTRRWSKNVTVPWADWVKILSRRESYQLRSAELVCRLRRQMLGMRNSRFTYQRPDCFRRDTELGRYSESQI